MPVNLHRISLYETLANMKFIAIMSLFLSAAAYADVAPIGSKEQVLLDGYRLGSFTQMHQVYPSRIISRGGQVREFPREHRDLSPVSYVTSDKTYSLEDYFGRSDVTGFLVIKDGTILYETYRQGKSENDVFASWSMTKSVVSTLVGLALSDGHINSLEDPLTAYVPDIEKSAYKDNSLKDLMQMSSGVEFVENYVDTYSLEAAAWFAGIINQQLPYNKTILWFDKRIAPPGTTFYYASMEPQVISWVTAQAVEENLSEYFSEKIWQKLGAEQNAYWMVDRPGGEEIGSCCISATLRDFARFGQLFADKGRVGTEQLVPESWIEQATRADPERPYLHAGTDSPRRDQMGYQHYWWLWPGEDHAFSAIGFGGQTIYVNVSKKIVIVQTATWGANGARKRWQETHAVIRALVDEMSK